MKNGFFRTFYIGYKRSKYTPKHKDGDRLHEPIPILFLSFSFWGAFFSFV